MQRILIALPDQTLKDLEELAAQKSISRAELIRLAADALIKLEKSASSSQALVSAFGLWKNNPMTDDELHSLRDEWES